MTPTELRDWRIKVCTDLANGVQYQIRLPAGWGNMRPCSIAVAVFNNNRNPDTIRPAPTPRKVWIGWPKDKEALWHHTVMRGSPPEPNEYNNGYNWQLVTEELK